MLVPLTKATFIPNQHDAPDGGREKKHDFQEKIDNIPQGRMGPQMRYGNDG